MPSIRERLADARAQLKLQQRADDKREDIGLEFTAWYNTAQTRLNSACTDDDPICMRVYSTEAKVAGLMAVSHSTNERQRLVGEQLIEAADMVKEIADNSPPAVPPHDHAI